MNPRNTCPCININQASSATTPPALVGNDICTLVLILDILVMIQQAIVDPNSHEEWGYKGEGV